jgi:zinc protease
MKRLLALALLAGFGCSAKNPAKTPVPTLVAAPLKPVAASDPEPFRATRPEPGPKANFDYPAPDELTLPNGLRVYLVPRASHVVALDFVLRSGAADSPVKKSGLASLTARMLTEGTRRKSSAALAEAVESLGTTLGADTSRDDSSLSLTVLPDDVSRALGLLAEVVTEPAFAENDFQRVRAEWLDGLRAERQDPSRLASLVAVRLAIGMVEGAPIDGALSDVEALTTKELREFHKQHYTPDNAALVVVGPFTKNELAPLISQAFASWRGKLGASVKAEPPALPLEKTRVVLVDRPGSVQSAIVALDPGPKRSDPGHEAREVVGRILGGLFTSRLNTNLREKHAYTYGAFARSVESRNWGALLVSTRVRTDATAPSLDEIFVELK